MSGPVAPFDQQPLKRRSGGRRLDASRDQALRSAALELLAELGYDRLTIDAIAERARAGKATIYRRWSGKAELIVDALISGRTLPEVPNTGTLRGDLDVIASRAANPRSHFDTQVMIGLITALPRDAALRQAFQDQFILPRVNNTKRIFQQAVERGEIAPIRNLDLLVAVLPALVMQRLLVRGEAPDAAFVASVIEDVILPIVFSGMETTR